MKYTIVFTRDCEKILANFKRRLKKRNHLSALDSVLHRMAAATPPPENEANK